jgi:hypothetical protein
VRSLLVTFAARAVARGAVLDRQSMSRLRSTSTVSIVDVNRCEQRRGLEDVGNVAYLGLRAVEGKAQYLRRRGGAQLAIDRCSGPRDIESTQNLRLKCVDCLCGDARTCRCCDKCGRQWPSLLRQGGWKV